MTAPIKLLAFAGSARRDSLNRKLLAAAVASAFGGLRALPFVRLLLSKLGVLVAPGELAVGSGQTAIGNGRLNDEKQQQSLDKAVGELITLTRSLKSHANH